MRTCNDWLDSYLKYTEQTEPCELYRKWVGISILASVMQRKCYIQWGHQKIFYPNLYIVLTGPPGAPRKSTAMKPALDFLSEPEIHVHLAAEAITREALIRELANSEETYFDDVGQIVTHSSLSVFSPELTVFLGYKNLALLSDLQDWFDCRDTWTYRTKNSGTDKVIGVWMNILGATTPALVQATLPNESIGGGLTSRIIFVFASDKAKSLPERGRSLEVLELRSQLLDDLIKIQNIKGEFDATKEFEEFWIDWYNEKDANPPFRSEMFEAYNHRRGDFLMKLSLISCVSRGEDKVISLFDGHRAQALLEEVEIPMQKALGGVGRNELSSILSRAMIEISKRKECDYRVLYNIFYRDVSVQGFEDVLKTLETLDFCVYFKLTGKIVWNPDWDKAPHA